mgnify:CR=1 FL=1
MSRAPEASGASTSRGAVLGTLLAVGIAAALSLGFTVWWTLQRERQRIDDNSRQQARRTAELAHLLLQRQVESGQALLGAVAASRNVQDGLAAKDRAALTAALEPFESKFAESLLILNDLDDRPIAFSNPIALVGAGLSGRVPDLGPHPRLAVAAGDLAVIDTKRIDADGQPLGQARVAVLVGRAFLRQTSSDLEAPLALLFRGAALHSTFTGDPPPPPERRENPRSATARSWSSSTGAGSGSRSSSASTWKTSISPRGSRG